MADYSHLMFRYEVKLRVRCTTTLEACAVTGRYLKRYLACLNLGTYMYLAQVSGCYSKTTRGTTPILCQRHAASAF